MDAFPDAFTRRVFLLHGDRFGAAPTVVASAPGRVNLIGEHVDYCGGPVLPMAIPNRLYLTLGPSADDRCHLFSSRFGEQVELDPENPVPTGDWADPLRGALGELAEAGAPVPPVCGVVDGDLPLGGGLSSSAAITMAFLTAYDRYVGGARTPRELASMAQGAEHRALGVACGPMDPLAIALGEEGHALHLDCRDGSTERVPVELAGHRVVLADSRVSRKLAGSRYNDRRAECERALEILRERGRSLASLRDLAPADLAGVEAALAPPLDARVRHVVGEMARVAEAVEALRAGAAERLGELLDASHRSLRDDFEVSHPDVDELVALARAQAGVRGARMTGAGFGGFVLLLVAADRVRPVGEVLVAEYYEPRDRGPSILDAGLGAAGARIEHATVPPAPLG